MNSYRKGVVLGFTVAEVFILLTFLLLVALLGLVQLEENATAANSTNPPRVWVRPEEIEALVNSAEAAQKARKEAEVALEQAERERDTALKDANDARAKQQVAENARAEAEQQRDHAERNLTILHRKGENPPCWYQVVATGNGETREKPYYAFNVAIYEQSIEMAPRTAPPGGASDDGGGLYADEWNRLQMDGLPYGKALSDDEFIAAVSKLVEQGENSQVRTYRCVFSVMVWDLTPDNAKNRWKYAHDRVIEGSFSAYTVKDMPWRGVE